MSLVTDLTKEPLGKLKYVIVEAIPADETDADKIITGQFVGFRERIAEGTGKSSPLLVVKTAKQVTKAMDTSAYNIVTIRRSDGTSSWVSLFRASGKTGPEIKENIIDQEEAINFLNEIIVSFTKREWMTKDERIINTSKYTDLPDDLDNLEREAEERLTKKTTSTAGNSVYAHQKHAQSHCGYNQGYAAGNDCWKESEPSSFKRKGRKVRSDVLVNMKKLTTLVSKEKYEQPALPAIKFDATLAKKKAKLASLEADDKEEDTPEKKETSVSSEPTSKKHLPPGAHPITDDELVDEMSMGPETMRHFPFAGGMC